MTSKYRCGTCQNLLKTHPKYSIVSCKKKEGEWHSYNDDCASHSDFVSERENVLDELEKDIKDEFSTEPAKGTDEDFSHEVVICILEKIKKLRGEP